MLIINALAVIWSFEIFLKSWLTNVNGVFLRVTPLGGVFKIHDFFRHGLQNQKYYGLSIITIFHQQLIQKTEQYIQDAHRVLHTHFLSRTFASK